LLDLFAIAPASFNALLLGERTSAVEITRLVPTAYNSPIDSALALS
jgi:hypothetical protein